MIELCFLVLRIRSASLGVHSLEMKSRHSILFMVDKAVQSSMILQT